MSSLLSDETNERLIDHLGDRTDRTISLYDKSIALLIDSIKSIDLSVDPFILSSKSNSANSIPRVNLNESMSSLISCVLLFLIQLSSAPSKTHRTNLNAILKFIKPFQISALNDEKLLAGLGESCKITITQLFLFLAQLDVLYSLLYT